MEETELVKLKNAIKRIDNFPKAGIIFRDIFPLFQDHQLRVELINQLTLRAKTLNPDVIVGLDARGFLMGPMIADRLSLPFVPVRKMGKLPPPTHSVGYSKEYGTDYFEISQESVIKKDSKVLIVDDLLATGGSAYAASELVKKCDGRVVGFLFVVELDDLNGKHKLSSTDNAVPVDSLFKF